MPTLISVRELGWGWLPDGKTVTKRADSVMAGLAKWLERNPGKVPRIVVSRKDDDTLGFALRKLTQYKVVTPAAGALGVAQGMVFFRAEEAKDGG